VVDEPELQLKQARLQLVTVCLQEVFTPLFWFLLLDTTGVVVILIYYGLRLSAEQVGVTDVAERAKSLMRFFDWLPSRLLALSFALVGQFVETWRYWLDNIRNFDLSAVEFVDVAAEKAVPLEHGQVLTPTLPMALVRMLAAYESLCYRSMFIWVVLFALHVVL
jgi:AmpE protein